MNIRTIPATAKEDDQKNVLRLIYKTRLKLFWRPEGLKGTPNEACQQLRFTRSGKMLTVVNSGDFYSIFDNLRLGNTKIESADQVSPQSSVSLPVPDGATGTSVTWRCITDYGNASAQYTFKLA
ncbi:Chaperone protein FocC precursor [compost metagenome]